MKTDAKHEDAHAAALQQISEFSSLSLIVVTVGRLLDDGSFIAVMMDRTAVLR